MNLKALLYSDGSKRSLSAAIYAAGFMLNRPGMELTVISFVDLPNGPLGLTREEEIADAEVLVGVSMEVIRETKRVFDERGVKVETVVGIAETGNMAARIAKFAEENNYNLIIMGTKGPTDFKALVAGSLAHAVVRLSPCPVLLVKKLPAEILDSLKE